MIAVPTPADVRGGEGVSLDPPKPRLRGWLHAVATPLVLAAGVVLVYLAPSGGASAAAAVYGASGLLLFATSAAYHRGTWSPIVHARLKRMDHANIYLIIAGSYTPIALLGLHGSARVGVLFFVWVGAMAGVFFRVFWIDAPRALYTALYITLGWCSVPVMGQLFHASTAVGTLIVVGGGLYTVGAIVYAARWPDPRPDWFGFHEVFHLFTIAAWVTQYVAVSILMYH